MDPQVLLQQIGIGNLMAVGARKFVRYGSRVCFFVGPTRQHRAMSITLTPADTYDVRLYVCTTGETLDTAEDIYCDNIGEVVRRLGDRP